MDSSLSLCTRVHDSNGSHSPPLREWAVRKVVTAAANTNTENDLLQQSATWVTMLLLLVLLTPVYGEAVDNKETGIVIGPIRYEPPWSKYPVALSRLLRRRREDQVAWWDEWGRAHHDLYEKYPTVLNNSNNNNIITAAEHLEAAEHAFRQGLQVFHSSSIQLDQKYDRVATQGNLLFAWGELYVTALSNDLKQDDDFWTKATRQFIAADQVYQQFLDATTNDDEQASSFLVKQMRRDVKANAAITAIRLGYQWITQLPSEAALKMEEILAVEQAKNLEDESILNRDWNQWLAEHYPVAAEEWKLSRQGERERMQRARIKFVAAAETLNELLANQAVITRRDRESHDPASLREHWISALKNAATASTMLGELEEAVKLLNEVLAVQETDHHDPDGEGVTGKVESSKTNDYADTLYSIADLQLQLGKYDASTASYAKAMDLYAAVGESSTFLNPDISVGISGLMGAMSGEGIDESVQEMVSVYEDTLDQYRDALQAAAVDAGGLDDGSGQVMYQQDDGYEGDIHTNLGTLYMSSGDWAAAESHFRQAMQLYSSIGEDYGRTSADVRINLAAVLLQRGAYMDSSRHRTEALEVYKIIWETEGVNPLAESFMWPQDETEDEEHAQGGSSSQADLSEETGPAAIHVNLDDYRAAVGNLTEEEETAHDEL